jgi:hypothetical protein
VGYRVGTFGLHHGLCVGCWIHIPRDSNCI